jgi:NAD(P)-dependent dehydrogenase (short-subunit alcohol dehydrogenase family)
MADGSVVIVGGTQGLGRRLAELYAERDRDVLITGRDLTRAEEVAAEIGGRTRGAALDLAEPTAIAGCFSDSGPIDHLVLSAIERDVNTVREYDIERAVRLATLKLVGYTEVVHCLHAQMHDRSSVLLYGGLAKDRPYPGSTTVTAVNGAVTTMIRTMALELAPIRVNAIHPGIVGDSPYWEGNEAAVEATKARTPTGRLATMDDVANASVFLLENESVNGVNLPVDGGWVMT